MVDRPIWEQFEATVQKVAEEVCRALRPVVPAGFRGDIRIIVDTTGLKPENVTITGRPRQPKAGGGR